VAATAEAAEAAEAAGIGRAVRRANGVMSRYEGSAGVTIF
jgi:hypothetical protein